MLENLKNRTYTALVEWARSDIEPKPRRERGESSITKYGHHSGFVGVESSTAAEMQTLYPGIASSGNLTQAARTRFDLHYLRAASRYICRENGMGAIFKSKIAQNVLRRDPTRPRFSKDIDQNLQEQIGKAWVKFWNSAVFENSNESAVEVERQLLQSCIEDGDFLLHKDMSGGNLKLTYYLSDQFYEQTTRGKINNNPVYMGVEHNENLRPLGYVVQESGLLTPYGFYHQANGKTFRIDAKNAIHIYDSASAAQLRGIPWTTPVISRLAGIKSFDTGVMAVMKVLGKVTYFIKKDPMSRTYGGAGGAGQDDADISIEGGYESDDAPILEGRNARGKTNTDPALRKVLDHSSVVELAPGEEIQYPTSQMPTSHMQTYRHEIIKEAIAGMGFHYAAFMGDYAATNFSGARQGAISDREKFKDLQAWWIRKFRKPIYLAWLATAEGRDFPFLNAAQREAAKMPVFIGPRWSWVDPYKDIMAYIKGMEKGIYSPQEVAEELGLDLEQTLTEISDAKKLAMDAGLDINWLASTPEMAAAEGDDATEKEEAAHAKNSP